MSAHGIETTMPVASAEVAAAIAQEPYAREVVWSRLPAPHRDSSSLSGPTQPGGLGSPIQLPGLREPADLRARVGQRDRRASFAIVMGWLGELGEPVEVWASEGPALVVWAQGNGKLAPATEPSRPGDVLVFDRVTGDASADLVGLVIGRDARGITEFVYAGGGVIRRGFLDPTRPSTRAPPRSTRCPSRCRRHPGSTPSTCRSNCPSCCPPRSASTLSRRVVAGISGCMMSVRADHI